MRLMTIAVCAFICALFLYCIALDVSAIRKADVARTLIERSIETNDTTLLNKADSIINTL